MELNKREAHCIARLLQGCIFNDNPFIGCLFCKYDCRDSNGIPTHSEHAMKVLMDETGVDLTPGVYGSLKPMEFPYKKFLKNSNEKTKEYFRNFFKNV